METRGRFVLFIAVLCLLIWLNDAEKPPRRQRINRERFVMMDGVTEAPVHAQAPPHTNPHEVFIDLSRPVYDPHSDGEGPYVESEPIPLEEYRGWVLEYPDLMEELPDYEYDEFEDDSSPQPSPSSRQKRMVSDRQEGGRHSANGGRDRWRGHGSGRRRGRGPGMGRGNGRGRNEPRRRFGEHGFHPEGANPEGAVNGRPRQWWELEVASPETPASARPRQWWELGSQRDGLQRDRRRNHGGRLSRLWAALSDPARPFNWESLPTITGHMEMGPGFTFDWDIDVDGLIEGDVEWWKGPNVCVREEIEEANDTTSEGAAAGVSNHHFFSIISCDATGSSYRCTTEIGVRDKRKKTVKIYECCHGYQREDDSIGCTKEVILKDVLATATDLGGGGFVEALNDTGFTDTIEQGHFTIFLPTNVSVNDFLPPQIPKELLESSVIVISPEMVSMASEIRESLATHIIEGFHRSSTFSDEMLLETENPDATIRINIYSSPQRLVTANCRVLRTTDTAATNGIIHEVDGPIPTPTADIWDTLRKDPKFTQLATMLKKAKLDDLLKKVDGHFTLFAPTDDAFVGMDKHKRERLLHGNKCMADVLKAHILPNVICSGVIQGQARSANLLSEEVALSRDAAGRLTVDGAGVLDADIVTNNGVIHVIDQVLVPQEALSIREALKNAGHTKFFQLVEEAGLSKQFDSMDDATYFIPTDQAFEGLDEEVFLPAETNTETVAKLLRYHVTPKEISSAEFLSNEELDTIGSDKKISIKKYYSHPFRNRHHMTAQCSLVTHSDIRGCEGIAHIVDKVLIPPRGDVLDLLYQDAKYSRLVATLKDLEIAEELQSTDQDMTVFALTNDAFAKLEKRESTWNYLQQHPNVYKEVLRNHIAIGRLCCSGIHESRWFIHPREQTLDGGSIVLSKRGGDVYVNRLPVATCDASATNGVVHGLDDFLAESIQKHVPIRHTGRHERRQNWWEVVGSYFDESQPDELFEVDVHWDRDP